MTPAFTSSSLKAIIALSNASSGILPASLSLFALTRTMTRIVRLPLLGYLIHI